MANTVSAHNDAVLGRRISDLFSVDAANAHSWVGIVDQLRDAGMLDDRRALMAIGGISASLALLDEHRVAP